MELSAASSDCGQTNSVLTSYYILGPEVHASPYRYRTGAPARRAAVRDTQCDAALNITDIVITTRRPRRRAPLCFHSVVIPRFAFRSRERRAAGGARTAEPVRGCGVSP